MHIELLEHPEEKIIAREDSSNGEFYLRADGSVWYRIALAPGDDCFVNSTRSVFLGAVESLHRYNALFEMAAVEEEQMVCVLRLTHDLKSVGALPGPPDSFWPLIVEQAEHGII